MTGGPRVIATEVLDQNYVFFEGCSRDRGRDDVSVSRPVRLPVPPPRHAVQEVERRDFTGRPFLASLSALQRILIFLTTACATQSDVPCGRIGAAPLGERV